MIWDLDDKSKYCKVYSFSFLGAFTYSSTGKGQTDKEKREFIRKTAKQNFPKKIPEVEWWAFRIFVEKSDNGFDIDNVPKLIIDAFCKKQIENDESKYVKVGLFPEDTIEHVRIVEPKSSDKRYKSNYT
mgnify:CR=1 FL=1